MGAHLVHGHATRKGKSPEYRAWVAAHNRCRNRNLPAFKRYGGRGIRFLYSSFQEFLDDVGLRPSPKHSLDRIDNDGDYKPGNCRWATWAEQMENRRFDVMAAAKRKWWKDNTQTPAQRRRRLEIAVRAGKAAAKKHTPTQRSESARHAALAQAEMRRQKKA